MQLLHYIAQLYNSIVAIAGPINAIEARYMSNLHAEL